MPSNIMLAFQKRYKKILDAGYSERTDQKMRVASSGKDQTRRERKRTKRNKATAPTGDMVP